MKPLPEKEVSKPPAELTFFPPECRGLRPDSEDPSCSGRHQIKDIQRKTPVF